MAEIIIDAPLGPYSGREEIESWLAELGDMPPDEAVKREIAYWREVLQERHEEPMNRASIMPEPPRISPSPLRRPEQ